MTVSRARKRRASEPTPAEPVRLVRGSGTQLVDEALRRDILTPEQPPGAPSTRPGLPGDSGCRDRPLPPEPVPGSAL